MILFTSLPRDSHGRVLPAGLTDFERFMQHVLLPSHDDSNTCWLYQGAITSSGHGCFRIRINGEWKCISAHKFSFLHYHGPILRGDNGKFLHIRHTCDVRHCVNPNHLILGTRSDNMQDMIARNRGRMQFGTPERAAIDDCPF